VEVEDIYVVQILILVGQNGGSGGGGQAGCAPNCCRFRKYSTSQVLLKEIMVVHQFNTTRWCSSKVLVVEVVLVLLVEMVLVPTGDAGSGGNGSQQIQYIRFTSNLCRWRRWRC
jgi:hypothetical protein